MHIDRIRELIADGLASAEAGIYWIDELQDTDPGHYGLEDLYVDASKDNIFVDVPNRTFRFTDVSVSFSARLGSSSYEDGIDDNITVTPSGEGIFDFSGNDGVVINSIHISGRVYLYEHE